MSSQFLQESLNETLKLIESDYNIKIENLEFSLVLTRNERSIKINFNEEQANAEYIDRRLRGILEKHRPQNEELTKQDRQVETEKRTSIINTGRTGEVSREKYSEISRVRRADGRDRESQSSHRQTTSTTYVNYPQIPMNELLNKLGWEIKREKTSRNHITMTNGYDTVVISRGRTNDNYLYYNVNDPNDKGTIFNFCKNRNVNIHELVNSTNIQEANHKIGINANSNSYSPATAKKYQELTSYNKTDLNSIEKIRMISKEITDQFSSLKTDAHKNIIFPTFSLEKADDKEFITICGMNKKLIEKTLTHDRDGVAYDKPINSLEEGKKGVSLLKADGVSGKDIKTLVLGEASFDNLAYAQVKNVDLSSSLLVSFNGSIKADAKDTFLHLLNSLPNAKEIVLAFDNDKMGENFDNQIKEYLKEHKNQIPITIDKSELKDWNEDLKAITLIKGREKLLDNGLSLKENISVELDKKIKLYHSYPDVPPEKKTKLFNTINTLASYIRPSQKQNEQLKRLQDKQHSLSRER